MTTLNLLSNKEGQMNKRIFWDIFSKKSWPGVNKTRAFLFIKIY